MAGIILNNYIQGRKKAVWLSVSSDLEYDIDRDLRETSANKITIFNLNKLKPLTLSADGNVVYSTYTHLHGSLNDGSSTRLEQRC